MGFLVLLCAHYANADETELIPLKNELKALITEQEERNNIPSGLLLAIATVESGSKPYALNIQGRSVIGRNKREAIDLIHEALANGITNIDVGVMQLNIRWHRENFGSIEEMLEPKKNIEYALLITLKIEGQRSAPPSIDTVAIISGNGGSTTVPVRGDTSLS
jgi:hypothetical protein